jgi:uncharacterized protein (TIGR03435 family)
VNLRSAHNSDLGKLLRRAALCVVACALPIAVGVVNSPGLRAQSKSETFVAASIKPNSKPPLPNSDGRLLSGNLLRKVSGGRLRAEKLTVRFLIRNAYDVKAFQVSGGPDWIDFDGFDLDAQLDSNASAPAVRKMLQSLLESRFALKVHSETKHLPVYNLLTVGQGLPEPKTRGCVDDALVREGVVTWVTSEPHLPPCGRVLFSMARQKTTRYKWGALRSREARLDGDGVSLNNLTSTLSDVLDRAVVDKTGFDGTLDIHLPLNLGAAMVGPRGLYEGRVSDTLNMPSFFDALGHLGLKLESDKAPVEILVIDHVEKLPRNSGLSR